MSIKGTVFKELSAQLIEKVPGLLWVDRFYNQFNNLDKVTIFFPCVLIEFLNTNYQTFDDKQGGDAMIRFHVGYENYGDTFQTNQDVSVTRENALGFYEFNEAVHRALQGFYGTKFTNLDRQADEEDHDNDMVSVTIMDYSTKTFDTSAVRDEVIVTPDPELNVTGTLDKVAPTPPANDDFVI